MKYARHQFRAAHLGLRIFLAGQAADIPILKSCTSINDKLCSKATEKLGALKNKDDEEC